MKPKVYIETSVISYLTARPNNDLPAMANQNATVEWWDTQRFKYDLIRHVAKKNAAFSEK
ncbi:hypothetical protein L6R29_11210 [Myxococcota bacterium]|nr:hypothetical protein [Myxococcota bacterium]